MQPGFQNGHGTGDGDKEAGRNRHQQRGGENLNRHGDTVERSGKSGNANTGQQADGSIDALHHFRGGGLFIGIHEVGNLTILAQQAVFAIIEIIYFYDAVEPDCFTHGIQLGHFCISFLEPGPKGHGHFQAEGGAAGNPQFHQAENTINQTGCEGDGQQCVYRKPPLKQIGNSIDHQMAAQERGHQHGQHLAENYQTQPVFRHHIQGEHGGDGSADQHNDHIQQQGNLKSSGADFGELIVTLFRTGNQFLFQLLQPGAGGKENRRGDKFRFLFKGRFRGHRNFLGWGGILVGDPPGFLQ